MTTLIHSDAVTYYAAQVRAALAGLDVEIVDDLTEGLEADLTEAILDDLELDGDAAPNAALASLEIEALIERFGPPREYAAELATAAEVSIPQPTTAKRRPIRDSLTATRATVGEQWAALKARHTWLRELADSWRSLRPVWWVARGWGLFLVLAAVTGNVWSLGAGAVPNGLGAWLLLLLVVALSVQVGRGRIVLGRWRRVVLVVIGVLGVYGAWFGLVNLAGSFDPRASESVWDSGYSQGLADAQVGFVVDGVPVTNFFVYDAAGQPVESARILDQDGAPVVLYPEWGGDLTWSEVSPGVAVDWGYSPAFLFDSTLAPNAFPYAWVDSTGVTQLPGGPGVDGEYSYQLDASGAVAPQWPAATLAPLPGASTATVEPSAEATTDPPAETADPAVQESTDPAVQETTDPAPDGEG